MASLNSNTSQPIWSLDAKEQSTVLGSSVVNGLTEEEAANRYASTRRPRSRQTSPIWLFLTQLKSPITVILIVAAGLSLYLRDFADALIVLFIVFASALLGFWQEYSAAGAIQKLLSMVSSKCQIIRGGVEKLIDSSIVVPGDIVVLSAGSSVPGDCLVLESRDLFVDEAAMTGETFPVEKQPGVLPVETELAKRSNVLFMGTHVVSGSAKALVHCVGDDTEFGRISQRLQLRPPETDFERGIRRFGLFLMEVTMVLVVIIFAINVYFQKPAIDAFLFSLALAVGLTPQLLPAIISVNLSYGARRMAEKDVIVRRLSSIENFGSMNVLCCDKTGTLTKGLVEVHATTDANGQPNEHVGRLAYLNASFETGFSNPIDEAIRLHAKFNIANCERLDECPYDFVRKRLSILVRDGGTNILITKGAVEKVLQVCDRLLLDSQVVPIAGQIGLIHKQYVQYGDAGYRTLGVAYRELGATIGITRDDEAGMVFAGFVVLRDPPKGNIANTIDQLQKLGISLKMITGDNQRVAANVAGQVGLSTERIVTGSDLRIMSDDALMQQVNVTSVFAEVEPNQKERIILACQKAGNVVGYMGDGINDATALHAADVGISVDQAVDVAKEAADIVLLKQDLGVLVQGVRDGRRTFANTMKYVFMATSANFGNMFSVAGASLFLNFLPLLPKQILLTNLLTDLPEMMIAGDRVDDELIAQPQKWDVGFIRRFMLVFGVISSLFDFATFGILLFVLKADEHQFQTSWFLESVVSATIVVLIVRTRRPLSSSLPSKGLVYATAFAILVTIALPWSPFAELLGFVPLSWFTLLALALIVSAYVVTAEIAKHWFYRAMLTRKDAKSH